MAFRGETSNMRFVDSVAQTSMSRHRLTLNHLYPIYINKYLYKGVLSLCCKCAAAVINLLYLETVLKLFQTPVGGVRILTLSQRDEMERGARLVLPHEREAVAKGKNPIPPILSTLLFTLAPDRRGSRLSGGAAIRRPFTGRSMEHVDGVFQRRGFYLIYRHSRH